MHIKDIIGKHIEIKNDIRLCFSDEKLLLSTVQYLKKGNWEIRQVYTDVFYIKNGKDKCVIRLTRE